MNSYNTESPLWWLATKYILRKCWQGCKWLGNHPVPGWLIIVFVFCWVFIPYAWLDLLAGISAVIGLFYYLNFKPGGQKIVRRMAKRELSKNAVGKTLDILAQARFYDPERDSAPPIYIREIPNGFEMEIVTPYGVQDKKLADLAPVLASGFRVFNVSVVPQQTHGSVVFNVLTEDPLSTPLTDSWAGTKLIEAGATSVNDRCPVGRDDRGETVSISLLYSSLLGAGLPGHGKSVALWELALFLGNDPKAHLTVIDLKNGVELQALQPRADQFCKTPEQAIQALDHVYDLMQQRYEAIRQAKQRKVKPDEETYVVIIDELAELFATGDSALTGHAKKRLAQLIKLGRAAGVIVIAFTQRPSTEALGGTSEARSQFSYRWTMRLDSRQTALMILGEGPVEQGVEPHLLPPAKAGGAGIGYINAETGETVRLRSWYLDDDEIDRLVSIITARRHDYLDPTPSPSISKKKRNRNRNRKPQPKPVRRSTQKPATLHDNHKSKTSGSQTTELAAESETVEDIMEQLNSFIPTFIEPKGGE